MTDINIRHLEPELLDGLPADDPRAIASRRDLVRINALMFQARIMASLFRANMQTPPQRILEIGAGDGKFMLTVARLMARRWPNVEIVMVDRIDLIGKDVCNTFAELGWRAQPVTADIFDWTVDRPFDLVCANLILHHFDDTRLLELLARIMTMAPVLVATEPLRAKVPLVATRLLPLIGACAVTLNDAAQSVRAGFRGTELSQLWQLSGGTPVIEGRRGLFTQAFVGASMPGTK
ncbi:class I SAM-dependent methyltransferase [Mesorhizobium neociceri]|uniref:Class I SAM-dependent methyltransferase n=1 Tax=Mesorhizobium neociceri TaxID=1307853 RepID=A0A838B1Y0_9HYPH|nr:class I SAM-dependent methyltransferase [Mesorhizobium neociceri]MBA1140838.1 class I SAM-dependent methyltransferase [Mesorhizobium neociceri]